MAPTPTVKDTNELTIRVVMARISYVEKRGGSNSERRVAELKKQLAALQSEQNKNKKSRHRRRKAPSFGKWFNGFAQTATIVGAMTAATIFAPAIQKGLENFAPSGSAQAAIKANFGTSMSIITTKPTAHQQRAVLTKPALLVKPAYVEQQNLMAMAGSPTKAFEKLLGFKPTRISSGFGNRVDPFTGKVYDKEFHAGTDLPAPIGTPIKFPFGVKVTNADREGGFGNVLRVKPTEGPFVGTVIELEVAHLDAFAKGVKKGKTVPAGTVIAYVGNTGRSTGPHAHLGLIYGRNKKDGRPIYKNPMMLTKYDTMPALMAALNGKKGETLVDVNINHTTGQAVAIVRPTSPASLQMAAAAPR